MSSTAELDVAIIGAGIAGLALGMRLAGSDVEFAIFERADEVGGTWRDNRYPGVECDVPAHLYSFSFAPKPDWSSLFASGSEIQQYLVECSRRPGLRESISLETEVLEARWDESSGVWHLETSRGPFAARVLVGAAGRLSEPFIPAIPGLDDFSGLTFHSSNWPEGLDLDGLRVGLVGTGASGVQLFPHLAATARSTHLFQRTPAWIVPKNNRAYSAAEKADFTDDAFRRGIRDSMFFEAEDGHAARLMRPERLDALTEVALAHLGSQVGDPRLRADLTPSYEIGCKRILLSDDFYPALAKPGVVFVPSGLDRVEGSRVVAADGTEAELDVLVFATGFHTWDPPFARRIVGRHGEALAEHWRDGMTAHATTTMHGFPNLFVLDGPNAALGHNSAVHMIESQVEYVLRALREIPEGRIMEASSSAESASTAEIDRAAGNTVWQRGGCASWYQDPRSGRLTLLWPGTASSFRDRLARFDAEAYEWRRAEAYFATSVVSKLYMSGR